MSEAGLLLWEWGPQESLFQTPQLQDTKPEFLSLWLTTTFWVSDVFHLLRSLLERQTTWFHLTFAWVKFLWPAVCIRICRLQRASPPGWMAVCQIFLLGRDRVEGGTQVEVRAWTQESLVISLDPFLSLTCHLQSVRKSCWIYLQKMPRTQALRTTCSAPALTQNTTISCLADSRSIETGLFASTLAPGVGRITDPKIPGSNCWNLQMLHYLEKQTLQMWSRILPWGNCPAGP